MCLLAGPWSADCAALLVCGEPVTEEAIDAKWDELWAHLDADGCELRWGLLPLRIRQIVGGEGEWQRLLRAHADHLSMARGRCREGQRPCF